MLQRVLFVTDNKLFVYSFLIGKLKRNLITFDRWKLEKKNHKIKRKKKKKRFPLISFLNTKWEMNLSLSLLYESCKTDFFLQSLAH